MDPVDQRGLLLLQGLGGADVGLDHELLDEPVGLEALGHVDALDAARPASLQKPFAEDLGIGQKRMERSSHMAERSDGEAGVALLMCSEERQCLCELLSEWW